MHILYLHQYFSTPNGRDTTAAYDFVRRWAMAGHRITVLTSVARITPKDLECSSDGFLSRRFHVDGIDVIAIKVRYAQRMGFSRRLLSFLNFMVLSTWYAVCIRNVDVTYASSTPLTIGVPAMVARWVRRRPFVVEIRDCWPDVPIQMGFLCNRFLIRAARALERAIYRNAEKIIAVSPGMATSVQREAPGKCIVMIPNNTDTDVFRPEADGSTVREAHGWVGKFVCGYAGAMGKANGVDLIIRTANLLRDEPRILFALFGEGSEKPRLIEEIRHLGLANITIADGMCHRDLPGTLAAVDLCLMTVAPYPILEHNSANKFFDYLGAGRPVLLNYGGWQREILEHFEAGIGCPMGNDREFCSRIVDLSRDPERLRKMAANARRLALERFSCNQLAAEALSVVTSVAA